VIEQAAGELQYAQSRRAQARKSHTKATRKNLRAIGIRLTEVPRCKWD
jgi:hypothetical protein